jgi:hypothetical protein
MADVKAAELAGGCHCGAIAVTLRLSKPAAETQVRACQCRFCRTHGALSVTDPRGLFVVRELERGALVRYRFGLKLADFLVCGRCGAYVGACMIEPDGALGVTNINVLEERDQFPPPEPIVYESETAEQRLARRRQRWTPTRVEPGS